jgi:hypothetical protein
LSLSLFTLIKASPTPDSPYCDDAFQHIHFLGGAAIRLHFTSRCESSTELPRVPVMIPGSGNEAGAKTSSSQNPSIVNRDGSLVDELSGRESTKLLRRQNSASCNVNCATYQSFLTQYSTG